jgi:hypothetical protein
MTPQTPPQTSKRAPADWTAPRFLVQMAGPDGWQATDTWTGTTVYERDRNAALERLGLQTLLRERPRTPQT